MTRTSRTGPAPGELGWLIDELADHESRIGTLEAPSGESRAAVLARTLANVNELVARETFAAEQTYTTVITLGDALPSVTPELAPITFTLAERRRVRTQGSIYTGLLVWTDGSGSLLDPRILIRARLGLTPTETGETTYYTSSISTGSGWSAGVRSLARRADRPMLEDYRILNPGEYTLSFSVSTEMLDGTGGSVTLDQPKTSVQILEKMP